MESGTDYSVVVALLKEGNWQAAHEIVQEDESELGAWAHVIVHMLEGDMANAAYWYRRAKRPLPEEGGAAGEIQTLATTLSAS